MGVSKALTLSIHARRGHRVLNTGDKRERVDHIDTDVTCSKYNQRILILETCADDVAILSEAWQANLRLQ